MIKYRVQPKDSIFSELNIRLHPDDAFYNAIKKGLNNPCDYYYMYSENGKDYFKHYITRRYISFWQEDVSLLQKIQYKFNLCKKIKRRKKNV